MMTDTKALTREIRIWAQIVALKRLAAETAAEYEACDREWAKLLVIGGLVSLPRRGIAGTRSSSRE